MNFNQEQQAAINSLGKNIMVSASAGSGKTTVLIARLMKRIVEDKVSLDEICALTFTEKAASEMKKRLAASLHEHYQHDATPFIRRQLTLLTTTQISTIHSFCLSIIREFGYLIGFEQSRIKNILDDLTRYRLEQEAIKMVLDKYYKMDSEAFRALSLAYSTRAHSDDRLAQDVINLHNLALTQLNADTWLDEQKTRYQINSFKQAPEILQSIFNKYLREHFQPLLDQYQALKRGFVDHSESFDVVSWDDFMTSLDLYLKEQAWDKMVDLLKSYENISIEIFKANKTNIKPELKDFNEDIKAFRNAFSDFPWHLIFTNESPEVYKQNQQFSELLVDLTIDFKNNYEALKVKEKALDFNDLEQATYTILSHPSGLAKTTLQARFKDILVDEYQDTNYFQDRIIELIARTNNVFRVGDVKQSIYGFRNAKPELMRRRMKQVDDLNQVLYLSNNYRSKENIVDFSNELFSTLMNLEFLGSEYTRQDRVKIGVNKQRENNLPVTYFQVDFDQTMLVDGQAVSINRNRALLNKIAQDIQNRIQSGTKPKDICVLARSHAVKKDLKEAFELLKIPYFFDDFEGFTNAWSIFDILNALQVFHNPLEDYYCLSFLLSGFCGLNENDIAELKSRFPHQPLYNSLKEVNPNLYQDINSLFEQLKDQSLISQLILITQFNGYYYHHLDNNQRNNVNFLFEKARNFFGSSLEFVDFIKDDVNVRSSNAAIDDETSNRVKVMTIHAAKGLQFPIVYYFMPKKINFTDSNDLCIMDTDLGLCFNSLDFNTNYRTKTKLRLAFELFYKDKEINESLRTLYVALTRAQNELVLIDGYEEKDDTTDVLANLNWHGLISGMGHALLIKAFLAINPLPYVETVIETISDVHTVDTYKSESTWPFEISDYQPSSLLSSDETRVSYDYQLDLTAGLNASEIGTILHRVISELPGKLWNDLDLAPYQLTDGQQQQLLRYNRHPMTQQLWTNKVYREVGFTHHHEGEIHVGVMDMVVESEHEIWLIDFKSDRVAAVEALIHRYQSQLDGYRAFLKTQFPNKTITTYLYSFSLNDYFQVEPQTI